MAWSFLGICYLGSISRIIFGFRKGILLKFYDKIGKWPSIAITFFLVVIGWIFFRIEKVEDAFVYIQHLIPSDIGSVKIFDTKFYFYFFLAIVFAFFASIKYGQNLQDAIYTKKYNNKKHMLLSALSLIMFFLCISFITASNFNPFIYFRF